MTTTKPTMIAITKHETHSYYVIILTFSPVLFNYFTFNNNFFILYFNNFFFLSFFPFLSFFSPFLSEPCHWQGLGAPAKCHAWASEVGQPSSGHWTTRDLPATCNIKWQKLSQRSLSQRWDQAPLNDQQAPVLDTLCQTTSKTGTQTHPLSDRLPKIIISSQAA